MLTKIFCSSLQLKPRNSLCLALVPSTYQPVTSNDILNKTQFLGTGATPPLRVETHSCFFDKHTDLSFPQILLSYLLQEYQKFWPRTFFNSILNIY